MTGPESDPTPRAPLPPGAVLTAKGTIVGMPPMAHPLAEALSTTLRSGPAVDVGPVSDAFHPERWSQPPSTELPPIIPCEEPEEEDVAKVMPRVAAPQPQRVEPPVARAVPAPEIDLSPLPAPRGGARRAYLIALVVTIMALASALLAFALWQR